MSTPKNNGSYNNKLEEMIKTQPALMVHFQLPGCRPCQKIEPILLKMHEETPLVPHYFAQNHEIENLKTEEFKDRNWSKFPYTVTFVKGRPMHFIDGTTADSLLKRHEALLQLDQPATPSTPSSISG